MATDLTVLLENRPGTIADLGEATGAAGVDILGGCGFPCEGRGVLHVLVDDRDVDRAIAAIEGADLEVIERREVMLTAMPAGPGSLGKLARRISDAGVNVDLLYIADDARLVLGCDDLETARQAV